MSKPIVKTLNVATGEETERPINAKELLVLEQDQLNAQAREQAETEKAEARSSAEAKLIELGLTVDDLKALLG